MRQRRQRLHDFAVAPVGELAHADGKHGRERGKKHAQARHGQRVAQHHDQLTPQHRVAKQPREMIPAHKFAVQQRFAGFVIEEGIRPSPQGQVRKDKHKNQAR